MTAASPIPEAPMADVRVIGASRSYSDPEEAMRKALEFKARGDTVLTCRQDGGLTRLTVFREVQVTPNNENRAA
jgi:hypothetical protein